MMLIGIVVGVFTGNITEVSNATISSAKEAVTLCITMLGVMSMWTGLVEIARKEGLIGQLTKGLGPILNRLFPTVPQDHPAREYIASNMIANVLGLGWAATPMGLKAMEALQELNEDEEKASSAMCTFLVINISSLQLIPVNIIAYRSQYGSVNPAQIVIPSIIATTISTLVGVAFCMIMQSIEKKNSHTKNKD